MTKCKSNKYIHYIYNIYTHTIFILLTNMRDRNKIFSDLSKFAVDAMSAFSGIREEIETIVSLRVNKIIKKMNLVKKDDFDILNNTISKLTKTY